VRQSRQTIWKGLHLETLDSRTGITWLSTQCRKRRSWHRWSRDNGGTEESTGLRAAEAGGLSTSEWHYISTLITAHDGKTLTVWVKDTLFAYECTLGHFAGSGWCFPSSDREDGGNETLGSLQTIEQGLMAGHQHLLCKYQCHWQTPFGVLHVVEVTGDVIGGMDRNRVYTDKNWRRLKAEMCKKDCMPLPSESAGSLIGVDFRRSIFLIIACHWYYNVSLQTTNYKCS